MFAFLKYMTWCLSPLSIVLFVLFVAAISACRRRSIFACCALTLTFFLLLFMSLPTTQLFLGVPLEERFPPAPVAGYQKADAIVVLGGGVGAREAPLLHPELYSAADRVCHAARLYKAGRAPLVVVSGTDEARAGVPLLEEFGIPKSAIRCDDKSRNTAENASFTLDLLRERKARSILLVTSAWHMPRALMLFSESGVSVIPAATDYEATLFKAKLPQTPTWQLLPSAEALYRNGLYVKEYLGLAFYTLKKPKKAAGK